MAVLLKFPCHHAVAFSSLDPDNPFLISIAHHSPIFKVASTIVALASPMLFYPIVIFLKQVAFADFEAVQEVNKLVVIVPVQGSS